MNRPKDKSVENKISTDSTQKERQKKTATVNGACVCKCLAEKNKDGM